ncbi:TlpA family protein disulfide reductase [Natrialba swarupiae]|uniref:TlpA family protein disulfide reductase n=1 Tax=Natrialba swarupiae TaxID=2448032 RepID=A0A5D5AVP2_9EURY|nr:TlpA disulfide reductase family protein [Natrialba swarupiae]TYT63640.1 TlpA family protein disulfide reductase [Natrialba swarupiae]
MKRRELVAGTASIGVLAAGGGVVRWGVPTFGGEDRSSDDDEPDEDDQGPPEISTIDARGSDAGTVTVPNDGVTVAMFFVTGCGNCQAQMSHLAEARETLLERDGDRVTVLSITYQTPETMPEADLREWWADLGGNWYVGYDSSPSLAASYGVVGYPATIVVDEAGEKRWHEVGVQPSSDIVQATDSVLEGEPTGSDRLANDNDDGG